METHLRHTLFGHKVRKHSNIIADIASLFAATKAADKQIRGTEDANEKAADSSSDWGSNMSH